MAILTTGDGVIAKDKWYPLEVDVWDPPFNTELKRRVEPYVALDKAQKAWRICVSIPHLKDPYWSTVNFALIDEARRLGVGLRLVEAGGYNHLDVQRKQILECMASGAESLIIAGISADGLNDLVEQIVADGKPVIDLINGISSVKITAKAAVNYFDPGLAAAKYIRELHGDDPTPVGSTRGIADFGQAWKEARSR